MARGRLDEALEHLRHAQLLDPLSMLFAALGEIDSAFTWLDRAYAARHTDIVSIKVDPMIDPLRGDPRFRPLVRKVGLDVERAQ
jgi:hypothetical protein